MAVRVAKGGDDCGCPKSRTIFADPPTLVLTLAVSHGPRENLARFIIQPGFLRIKDREVFADNFRRFITFETLRAGVPTRDVAFRVQLENGVLANPFHDQAKALFAFAQGALVMNAVRDLLYRNTETILGERKYPDGVNVSFFRTVSKCKFAQVAIFSAAERSQQLAGDWCFENSRKVSERLAKHREAAETNDFDRGWIRVHDSKCPCIIEIVQQQKEHAGWKFF